MRERSGSHAAPNPEQSRSCPAARPPSGPARLLDLQRTAGNDAVCHLLGATTPVQRQAGAPAATAATSRATFEADMARRFGVTTVRTGTFADQQAEMNARPGVQQAGQLTAQNWTSWDPGASSPIYESIVAAFDDFESRLGGTPPTTEIVFYDTAYEVSNGSVVPAPQIGADFGAGHLRVYRSGVGSRRALPIGRSNAAGNYAPVGLAVTGIPGQDPGAPLPLPAAEQSIRRTITHELGHGLAEQAMTANPNTFVEYRRSVGWVGSQLFDVGIPAVRAAVNAGTPPPASVRVRQGRRTVDQPTQITPADWNHPRWIEQPVSHYMVDGGPAEDFAEAVMTYVDNAPLLRERCPSRYAFLEAHRDTWLPYLVRRPPVGDFPSPPAGTRVA